MMRNVLALEKLTDGDLSIAVNADSKVRVVGNSLTSRIQVT